ncbi:hypothetical protein PR048_006058 [Dryococelus australis]|uniref:Uncharacterized protein n=1 Tax=Dryococelus australis TaxID=614101 RepID=A0ABQ9I9X1_9NEOP|nr:hypothetical protein PR048_006058 [Dryococelus australis]
MKLLSDGSHGLCPIFDDFTFQGSAISVGQDWRSPRTCSIGTIPIDLSLTQDECDSGNTHSPVAGLFKFMHQPHLVRLLQQEVPAGLRGDPEESALLRPAAVLRIRHDVLVGEPQEVVLLREQQQLDEASAAGAGHLGVLHLQQHRGVEGRACRPARGCCSGWSGGAQTPSLLFPFGSRNLERPALFRTEVPHLLWSGDHLGTRAWSFGIGQLGRNAGSLAFMQWEFRVFPTAVPLASHQGKSSSISGQIIPAFSHVGIVPDDAAGRRVFSGISRFPRLFIPALLHTHLNRPYQLSRPRCSEPPNRFTHSPTAVTAEIGFFFELPPEMPTLGARQHPT